VTVLLMGSFHAGKQGGHPFGNVFLKSVMARLGESTNLKPVSLRFAAIYGEFAKIEIREGKLVKIPVSCDEWGREEIQIEFKKAISELAGNAFITDLANIDIPDILAASYMEWADNYDFLISLRNVSPDI